MTRFPEPRYRRVPPRRAARIQQTLARLGVLAQDAARGGTDRWADGMTRVLAESHAELEELGLDAARQVVADAHDLLGQVRQEGAPATRLGAAGPVLSPQAMLAAAAARRAARSLYAQVAPGRAAAALVFETPAMVHVRFTRALLKLALLAPAARNYPEGPAPRALLEPLVRATLAPDERPILKGRVLVPLAAHDSRTLAFDAELGLVSVSGDGVSPDTCALARRLVFDHQVHQGGLPTARVRGVIAGVAVGQAADRPVIAAARASLADILRVVTRELADPFRASATPVLVGPLRHLREGVLPGFDLFADASGQACAVPGPLVPPQGGSRSRHGWYLLAEPRARGGILELAPLVAWCHAPGERMQRVIVDRPQAPPHPEPHPLLDTCAEALADLTRAGVARGLASRDIVRDHARELASAGYGALAARLDALLDAAPERASPALHGAVHLLDRLRRGPRTLISPDREVSK